MPDLKTPLDGKHILITRPAGQAGQLAAMIRQAGGVPQVFPMIEISGPDHPEKLRQQLAALDQHDLAIFISPTAVEQALAQIPSWPQQLRVATIGQGSARALMSHGINEVIVPATGHDSEALLALPELQDMAGVSIIIFSGEEGRTLLADTLRERGAKVEQVRCYRRTLPKMNMAAFLLQQDAHPFDAIILTSREALANFRSLTGEHWQQFANIPFFVPHPSIGEAASEAGVTEVFITASGDQACIEALSSHFSAN